MGATGLRTWFRDDTAKRFDGYHWHVIPNVDGYNPEAIAAAAQPASAMAAVMPT